MGFFIARKVKSKLIDNLLKGHRYKWRQGIFLPKKWCAVILKDMKVGATILLLI
jgi:hypothetical protein